MYRWVADRHASKKRQRKLCTDGLPTSTRNKKQRKLCTDGLPTGIRSKDGKGNQAQTGCGQAPEAKYAKETTYRRVADRHPKQHWQGKLCTDKLPIFTRSRYGKETMYRRVADRHLKQHWQRKLCTDRLPIGTRSRYGKGTMYRRVADRHPKTNWHMKQSKAVTFGSPQASQNTYPHRKQAQAVTSGSPQAQAETTCILAQELKINTSSHFREPSNSRKDDLDICTGKYAQAVTSARS